MYQMEQQMVYDASNAELVVLEGLGHRQLYYYYPQERLPLEVLVLVLPRGTFWR